MKIIEALEIEKKHIEENKNAIPYMRDDFNSMLVAFVFDDGQIHYLMPPRKEVILEIINDLIDIMRDPNGIEKSLLKFEEQKLTDLIDEGEFKI